VFCILVGGISGDTYYLFGLEGGAGNMAIVCYLLMSVCCAAAKQALFVS
jgi:hypothetical protein